MTTNCRSAAHTSSNIAGKAMSITCVRDSGARSSESEDSRFRSTSSTFKHRPTYYELITTANIPLHSSLAGEMSSRHLCYQTFTHTFIQTYLTHMDPAIIRRSVALTSSPLPRTPVSTIALMNWARCIHSGVLGVAICDFTKSPLRSHSGCRRTR